MNTSDVLNAIEALRVHDAHFAFNGRGPAFYDCYGLVKALYEDIHAVVLPDFKSPEDAETIFAMMTLQLHQWDIVYDMPGVLISMTLPNGGGHVGLSLGDGRFIHIWERSGGVRIENIEDWQRFIQGFHIYVGQ